MLEMLFNSSIENTTLRVGQVIFFMFMAFILGLMIMSTYIKTNEGYHSENFVIALLMLPILMSSIILFIGNNVAGAFSLAGIFSIIRFRSAPGSAKDIVYILFCVGAGLACGIQVPFYGFIFTLFVCGVLLLIDYLDFGKRDNNMLRLKILVPEDMNGEEVFEDVLEQYTKNYKLSKMRTKDFGSVYELTFLVTMEDETKKHEMIDELRCRNGNLNIILSMISNNDEF